MFNIYLKLLAIIVVFGVSFGVVFPMLFSARDSGAVTAGFVLLAAVVPGVAWLIWNFFKSSKAELSKIAKKTAPFLMLFALVACDRVEAGYVGVKVNLLGDGKGVQQEVVGPGRYWLGWNEQLFRFPTFTVTDTWGFKSGPGGADQSIGFQTIEGLSVKAEVGITFNFQEAKVAAIFQKYRRGVEEISDTFLRNIVRDAFVTAASTKPVEFIYGAGKADLLREVERLVRDEVGDIGIVVENITAVSEFRFPDSVFQAINAKIAATQQAQQRENEVQTARAEAAKRIETARGEAESILTVARAQAEANAILARSLTQPLVSYKAIERWNGELPRLTGQGAIPFINVPMER